MDQDHAAGAPPPPPPWALLPGEVLGEVARHLHDAADFLRFHAACRPWRAASPSLAALHPWLVAPCGLFSSGMHFRRPFSPPPPPDQKGSSSSSKSSLYLPHLPALRGRRFAAADAATGRLLAAGIYDDDPTASLVNPLTGDAAPLPPIPYRASRGGPASSRGVVCSDGAVLCDSTMGHGFAAVLRPGEAARWEEVRVASPAGMTRRDAMRLMDEHDRRAATMCSAGVLAGGGNRAVAKLPPKPNNNNGDRYVLEYRGELLCADVIDGDPAAAVSVSVHALEASGGGGGDGGEEVPRWVERGRSGRGSMERVCLFLGWESSFAADAEEFAGGEVAGGCAYFVARRPRRWTESMEEEEVYGVCRYSFEDGTATVVEELPGMFDKKSMWYTPRPKISPVPSPRTD
ncbi:unnamed protein product [Urochloa humidicola]